MRLLIIDDEAHIRELMRMTLEAAGYQVDEAADGEEGLVRFGDGGAYDVVLLDEKMPGIDGIETLKRILARAPDAPIVMVTAFATVELAVDAMRSGATDFLRKPMTPEALRGSVAAALARHPARPSAQRWAPAADRGPLIQSLTLNGFRIVRRPALSGATGGEHVFQVTHFPDGSESTATVTIDGEAVARVARLTGRALPPGGSFWRNQAERILSAYLWTEGRLPDDGRLTVSDVSREDLDMAASWSLD
jgi:CheY-like chemotaxis protein